MPVMEKHTYIGTGEIKRVRVTCENCKVSYTLAVGDLPRLFDAGECICEPCKTKVTLGNMPDLVEPMKDLATVLNNLSHVAGIRVEFVVETNDDKSK